MLRTDQRASPIRRLVVMGESNAYGMNAVCAHNEWVQTVGNLIREFQGSPLRIFNNAIPSNVISPDAPGYTPGDAYRTSPSAIERYRDDMIAYQPDLAMFAYGLNDSRCGHDPDSFMQSYREIVTTTKQECPEALIVLVGPYWNPQYDAEHWQAQNKPGKFGKFGRPGDDIVTAYNAAIAAFANDIGVLFVDVYRVLEGATWLITADDCHFNDVGQRLIGMTVFSTIAQHCSFIAQASNDMESELASSIRTTGGTNALPHVIDTWPP